MRIPPRVPWLVWRLVVEDFATLQEVETHYSLSDVVVANALLDCRAIADDRVRRKGGQK